MVLSFRLAKLCCYWGSLGAGLLAVAVSCAQAEPAGEPGDEPFDCIGPHCEAAGASDPDAYTADVGAADSAPDRVSSNVCGAVRCDPDDLWATGCVENQAEAADASDSSLRPAPVEDAAVAEVPDPPPAYGCYVQRADQAEGDEPVAISVCAPAGTGHDDDPCLSSADCAPGFGCVGEESGVCRRFCCEGIGSCYEPGTYCAMRPLLEEGSEADSQLDVPVCVPGDDCNLSEPFPCYGDSCTCPDDENVKTACTVVRSDGTTACLPPGLGEAGEPCPCKAHHICSESTGTCLRLCETSAGDSDCDLGHCQSSAALPAGYGVCTMEGLAND